jgi:hypothetical protein
MKENISRFLMSKEIIRYEIQEILDDEKNNLPTHIFFLLKYHFDECYPTFAMEAIINNNEERKSEYYNSFSSYRQVIEIFKRQLKTMDIEIKKEQKEEE